jgi:hypothetical protein
MAVNLGCLGLMLLFVASQPAAAVAWTPVQFSLSPQVQVVDSTVPVHGLRFAFPFGESDVVNGLDLGVLKTPAAGTAAQVGFVCLQAPESRAVAVAVIANWADSAAPSELGAASPQGLYAAGVFNRTADFTGAQLGGIANSAGPCDGVQMAGWTNACDAARGVQLAGFSNLGRNAVQGLQAAAGVNLTQELSGVQVSGLCNGAASMPSGAQVSALNLAGQSTGVQFGIINAAKSHQGLQVGVLNINTDGPIPIMIGLNAGWNMPASGASGPKCDFAKNEFIGASIVAPILVGVIGALVLIGAHNTAESFNWMQSDWF